MMHTDTITPGCANALREVCNSTCNTLNAISDASALGSGLNVVAISDGGFSWMISIVASDNHTAVSCRCAAKHTNSKSGPAGSDTSVRSEGSAVIALNRSLNAYNIAVCVVSVDYHVKLCIYSHRTPLHRSTIARQRRGWRT